MPSGSLETEFSSSPREVWDIISDYDSAPAWVPNLVSVSPLTSGPLTVGSRFAQLMHVMGREMELTITITELDPPVRIAYSGEGKSVKITGRSTISETSNGCALSSDWSIELSGMMRLSTPLAVAWTRDNLKQTMKALADRLSQQG